MQSRAIGFSAMFSHLRWALSIGWDTSRFGFATYWINSAISSLLPAAAAVAVGGLVNGVAGFLAGDAAQVDSVYLWLIIGFCVALAVVITESTRRLIAQRLRADLNYRILSDILVHSAGMDFAYFEDPAFRESLQRARKQPAQHLASLIDVTLNLIVRSLQIGSLLAVLLVIEPILVMMLVPIGAPYLWIQWKLAKDRFEAFDTMIEKSRWMDYYTGTLTREETVAEVKLLDLAPVLIRRARRIMAEFKNLEKRYQLYLFASNLVFAVASVLAVYYSLTRATLAVLDGSLSIGEIAIFGGVAMRLRSTVESLIGYLASFRFELFNVGNLRYFLELEPKLLADGSQVVAQPTGEIEFRDVSFAYSDSAPNVLSNLSFRIEPGETVALVGKNGAGKTTVAKLIARFYDPGEGAIYFGRHDLRDLQREDLRRQIAFVFQRFGRYSATAADNIAFGDWQALLHDREKLEAYARLFGIHDLIESMPDGYDTVLGRTFGYHTLSGGQWQLLAIARALVREASLIILDEPTANLDARAEYELFSRFREIARGNTTLLISHRFSTVKLADRILVLDGGEIVESGTHDELVSSSGLYASLYRMQRHQMTAESGSDGDEGR